MEDVESQFREEAYGGLTQREARLKQHHDDFMRKKEDDEILRLAKDKISAQVCAAVERCAQLDSMGTATCKSVLCALHDIGVRIWACLSA